MNFNKINNIFFLRGALKWVIFAILTMIFFFQFAGFSKIFLLKKPRISTQGASNPQKQLLNKKLELITGYGTDNEGIAKTLAGEFSVKGILVRPDIAKPLKAKILLNKSQEEIEIEDRKPLFVFFDSQGFMGLTDHKIASPITIIPHIYKKEVDFFIEEIPHQAVASFSLSPIGDSQISQLLNLQFSTLRVQPIDALTKFYQTKGEKKFKATMNGYAIYIDEGECFGFDRNGFTSSPLNSQYLIQVKAHGVNQIKIECFDQTGFYSISFYQNHEIKSKMAVPKIEEPKQVALRGLDRISCIFQGKKQTMQKGDFFILENNIWRKIFSLEELNALIEYKIQNEIFVIEEIITQDKTISLKGMVFDKSRLNFSPINWRFENKRKKEKELMKSKSNPVQSIDNTANLGLDETEEAF